MNLKIIYSKICNRGQVRELGNYIYSEKHHIIPKCMGGSNNVDNITKLTAREHFICHKILCELYPNNDKLKYAFWAMCNQKDRRQYIVTSRDYQHAKSLCMEIWKRSKPAIVRKRIGDSKRGVKLNKDQKGGLNHNYNKIWITNIVTAESKMIIGDIPEGWKKGRVKIGSLGQSKVKGKSWYYKDGKEKYFGPDEETEGWSKGRLPRVPYKESKEADNTVTRIFNSDTDPESLVWHRDRNDREIAVIGLTDWQFQLEDSIPQKLQETIFIPKNTYHRLIKGTGDLDLRIFEF